ncbi:MAG TPA: cytochrome b/b6 domain-containing protein [Burkholderiales bacterium]|nr:cytochrome b/b6 domain-containing protein [Burkholderiales bacterium]
MEAAQPQWVKIHPLVVRITHWINAFGILIMVASGWRIYNASPLFSFRIPNELTLGGWLAGALQWHFAAMWLLVINGIAYVIYGIVSGHFRRKFFPLTPSAVFHDVLGALRGKLAHEDLSVYNAAQRAAYLAIILCAIVLVLSGLAIWKPVQLQEITAILGGYESARVVHFLTMALLVLIVAVHVAMVILVPRTFPTMITGRARRAS